MPTRNIRVFPKIIVSISKTYEIWKKRNYEKKNPQKKERQKRTNKRNKTNCLQKALGSFLKLPF